MNQNLTKNASTPRLPDVPAWLWIGLPMFVLALEFAIRAMGSEFYQRWNKGEDGITELITVAVLAVAIGMGIAVLRIRHAFPDKRLTYWIGLLTLGCVYFLGEEISWGQHFFGWDAPEAWAEINAQNETNLHNLVGIGGLFDNVPRNLLTAFAFLGGAVLPLYLRQRKIHLSPASDIRYWLFPTIVCLVAGVLALFITVPDKIMGDNVPMLLDIDAGETKECFLAMFLMFYLASIWLRLRAFAKTQP